MVVGIVFVPQAELAAYLLGCARGITGDNLHLYTSFQTVGNGGRHFLSDGVFYAYDAHHGEVLHGKMAVTEHLFAIFNLLKGKSERTVGMLLIGSELGVVA